MIKVIVGYELKEEANIQHILLKLRSYALTFPGFISAEHIRSVKTPPRSEVRRHREAEEGRTLVTGCCGWAADVKLVK